MEWAVLPHSPHSSVGRNFSTGPPKHTPPGVGVSIAEKTPLKFLRILSLGLSACLWGSYAAYWIGPHRCAPLALLPLGFLVWVVLSVVCAIPLALKKQKEAGVALISLLVGSPVGLNYLGVNRPVPTSPPHFRVMTFNVKYFSERFISDRSAREAHIQSMTSFFKHWSPDILCGQDFTMDGKTEMPLLRSLREESGLTYCTKSSVDSLIYSRYPILEEGQTQFPDGSNSYTWADLQTPQGRLRVFSLHLHSYGLRDLPRDRYLPLSLYRRLTQGLQIRAQQAVDVADEIARSPYPVLVCGDLNEVPVSYAYRKVSHGLTDAFRVAGWGSGITYRGPLPWLRIDYIFCSPSLVPVNYVIPPEQLSDHYAAVCDIVTR